MSFGVVCLRRDSLGVAKAGRVNLAEDERSSCESSPCPSHARGRLSCCGLVLGQQVGEDAAEPRRGDNEQPRQQNQTGSSTFLAGEFLSCSL